MQIKQVRKELGLNNLEISKLFGYNSVRSYQNSSKRPVIDNAIVKIYELTKKSLLK